MYKKYYDKKVIDDLYEQAIENYHLVNQWMKPSAGSEYYENSLRYLIRTETLLETIESAVAFSVGGGIPEFSPNIRTLEQRLKSVEVWLNGS